MPVIRNRLRDEGFDPFNRRDPMNQNRIEPQPPEVTMQTPLSQVNQQFPSDSISHQQTQANMMYVNEDQESSNFVTGVSGWKIWGNGDVEFNNGTFRGTLTAGSIHIPDEDTTANSFHVDSNGNMWIGCTSTSFTADNQNAKVYFLKDGSGSLQTSLNVGNTTGTYVVIDGANELIKSSNFSTGSTGWQIEGDGTVEFNSGTFRGDLIAGSIHIPDQDSTANSFHTDSDGNSWWGCTSTSFTADNDNAPAYILKDGTSKFSSVTISEGSTIGTTAVLVLEANANSNIQEIFFTGSKNDGFTEIGTVERDLMISRITDATNGTLASAELANLSSGEAIDWSDIIDMSFTAKFEAELSYAGLANSGINSDGTYGVAEQARLIYNSVAGTFKAVCADGANSEESTITGITATNWNYYRIVSNGSQVEFYVNGTLKATLSTYPPSGSSTYPAIRFGGRREGATGSGAIQVRNNYTCKVTLA